MRSLKIDYLRILLCLAIVEGHYTYITSSAGGIVVVGFFVLSGYFLGKSFDKNPDGLNWPLFFKRKAQSLLPDYMFAALIGGIACLLNPEFTIRIPVGSCFIVNDILFAFNGPSWFMLNLFLYMAFAPIFFCLYRTKWGIYSAFIMMATYSLIVHLCYTDTQYWTEWLYYSAQLNVVYFVAGVLSYRIMGKVNISANTKKIMTWAAFLFVLAVSLLNWQFRREWVTIWSPYVAASCLGFAVLVPLLDTPMSSVTKLSKVVIWASSLSYAVYLFHYPVREFVRYLLMRMDVPQILQDYVCMPHGVVANLCSVGVFWGATIACAILFTEFKKRMIGGGRAG